MLPIFCIFSGHILVHLQVKGSWESRLAGPGLSPSPTLQVQMVDHGHVWPLHLSVANASEPHISLQKLLIAWRNQAQRHALVIAPAVMAIQVGRFRDDGSKLRFRIRSSRRVYVPAFSSTSMQTTSYAYTVEAVVFHLGDARDSGHYRTAFLRQGVLSRLTDDGELPAPVHEDSVALVETNAYVYFLSRQPSTD